MENHFGKSKKKGLNAETKNMEGRFGCRVRLNLLLTENQLRSAKKCSFFKLCPVK
jgi:hypothetical protein